MSRIPGITDFSEFVRRTDTVKVHDVVNLLVGENVIKVNGLVISQKSQVLLEMVKNQADVYLDDFAQDLNGVQDCVELLSVKQRFQLNKDLILSFHNQLIGYVLLYIIII